MTVPRLALVLLVGFFAASVAVVLVAGRDQLPFRTYAPGLGRDGSTEGFTPTAELGARNKVVPPPSGVYIAANPDFGGGEDEVSSQRIREFEQLTGRRIAWAYFSDNWHSGVAFPSASVRAITETGAVPFIRMMSRSTVEQNVAEPVYRLDRITRGDFDKQLAQWARDARASGVALMVEFGTEVNGEWFSWNGKWYGGASGPKKFRDAYRHIIDLFRSEGVDNITWVFHVNADAVPQADWNTMKNYYPGDDYIDWLGVSVYGAQTVSDDWVSFADALAPAYAELAAVSATKPIAVLEFGVTDGYPGHSKADWIRDAFAAIESGRFPRLRAMSYWNETWENDDGSSSSDRIDSSPAAAEAYRSAITSAFFVDRCSVSAPGP